MKRILFIFLALLPLFAWAQIPSIDPVGTYYLINEVGEEETGDVNGQTLSAPFRVVFEANPTIPIGEGFNDYVWYEWKLWKTNEPETILLRRNDASFEYDFNESGSYTVQLCAIFYDENGISEEDIRYRITENAEERDEEPKIITLTVSESKLEFPNAISPGCSEGSNDTLKPKDGYKGIIAFHAVVFNRWGKKLYSWDDVNGCWDGKYNGKYVKDGVYFLNVSAKGSDGIDYKIKKAINVITGYTTENAEGESGTTE
ncbi:MAG: gliding motility-associated C-terminal domain-containing protein [Bacteroidaceae bacterium]|nr:gliding motility-associated C-terminal domain-containing protein [Bacteroidaceae bacterium]